jgi:hypothetical protein
MSVLLPEPEAPTWSGKAQLPSAKIDGQVKAAEEVQPKEVIDANTWRQGVTEYRKSQALQTQSINPLQDNTRCKLHPASRSDLDPQRS